MTSLYPAGGQRGATTEVAAVGAIDKATKLWASGKGIQVEPGKAAGKFSVKVAGDAVPGTYWFRAYNGDGASTLRPFIVGTVPELLEAEPNDDAKKPQTLHASAVVVNGKLAKAGDVDCFAIATKKGQTLVASVEANRTLKSPMDGVLQIVSTDGFVLDQNHDYHGLDPQIAYTVPADGTYIVRLFAFSAIPEANVRFAGGETYFYRLTVTTGGFIDRTMPLAVGTNAKSVTALGWNIPEEMRTIIPVPLQPGDAFASAFHPKLANTLRVRVEKHEIIQAMKEAGTPPFSTSQMLTKPRSEAMVRFVGKKGRPLAIGVESRSLSLALDPVIRIVDAAGKQLARAEPSKLHSDTALSFTPPADGEFTAIISDLYGGGSPLHAFLLRVLVPEPDFELTVAADRFAIPPGKTLDIPVKIVRKNGFTKIVAVSVEGLPAGVTAQVKPPTGKADPNSATLTLSAAKAGISGAFRIVGRVEPSVAKQARAPLTEFEDSTADLWATVSDKPVAAPPKKKKR
ncbi:MAG TPA: PPC domain-containing protein [Gemmataceae bacterium]